MDSGEGSDREGGGLLRGGRGLPLMPQPERLSKRQAKAKESGRTKRQEDIKDIIAYAKMSLFHTFLSIYV